MVTLTVYVMQTESLLGSLHLHDALYGCIETFGVAKTIQILNESRAEFLGTANDDLKKVLSIVSSKFRITVSEIIHGKGRKNERIYALGMCVHLLRIMEVPPVTISKELCLDRIKLWRNYKKIKELSPKHQAHEKMLEIKQACEQEVKKYKNQVSKH